MTNLEIVRHRVIHQRLSGSGFKKASAVVAWLGAMQAQEFGMARWAIGLRAPGLSDAEIERAFNQGEFLRTHALRPTWHFVAPADIRWMLSLSAPQVIKLSASLYRQVELDEGTFQRSNATLVKVLQGGHFLTRKNLQSALHRAKIRAEGQRLAYLMMRAELDGIICSGPRSGKMFTYALLEERVPPFPRLDRGDALARLSTRYFNSRGPATVQDFARWSGLSVRDARSGAESLSSAFVRETAGGQNYIFPIPAGQKNPIVLPTFLMPEYDEYEMSYRDRGALLAPNYRPVAISSTVPARNYPLVIEGLIAGTWRRHGENHTAIVEKRFLHSLKATQQRAVQQAVRKYETFFGLDSSIGHKQTTAELSVR